MTGTGADHLAFLRATPPGGRLAGEPVSAEQLAAILDVAAATGSSGGRRPWQFVTITRAETLRALAALAPEARHLATAPAAIVVVMPGGQVALDAYDEGRVAERILLAARAAGLSGRIGWVLADQRDAVRALLGIPEGLLVRTTVAIGRARQPATSRGARREPPAAGEIVHHERW